MSAKTSRNHRHTCTQTVHDNVRRQRLTAISANISHVVMQSTAAIRNLANTAVAVARKEETCAGVGDKSIYIFSSCVVVRIFHALIHEEMRPMPAQQPKGYTNRLQSMHTSYHRTTKPRPTPTELSDDTI
jgi:hypothetical protein